MSTQKKQCIRLKLTDKIVIEEIAKMTEQHRCQILSEESRYLVMDAISNPPAPNIRLKRAARRLRSME
ncbi:type II toxin -antitoxin system TacA 1-like antitoxin [Scandinavium lactucae]|uniref:DUF1778 domain-containing protein n=1 Tax=Scandinavium lactucae TaxID=3095028 RepID=A0ABU4QMS5_9ENTR|nr:MULTISPECIES: DUF1778 domain-containing protein [unclassified Scandinavium]MDX6040541.1 DUF1778 domain-containing protein [Scandinavium sp. V105_6]MDX6048756.1 DUF1778 domain-containing protein [Scandinavium sp. V105_1]